MSLWPFRHFGLKVLSLSLAVLLWLAVAGEQTVERALRIPLELQQFPPGLELVGEPPGTVDIRVRGASGQLSRLSTGDLIAVIDLHSARPGRRLFHLTPEQVRAPAGIDVVQVNPTTLAITFEPTGTREVPVVPAVEGRPAPGFVVGTVRADPETVEVVGPETQLRRAIEAMTEPVSVAGARNTVSEQVSVGLADPNLRLKTSRTAIVTISILPAPGERVLRNVPVRLRNLGPGLTAQAIPAAVSLSVRGSREALEDLTAGSVTIYVDLSGVGAGSYELTPRADATRDFGITAIDPPAVRMRIK